MKSLVEFINEQSQVNEESTSKTITLDFTDLENAEETLKSLEGMEGCTIEDKKLTVTITSDNVSKLGTVQDILQQYSNVLRSSSKRTNDEQYAQKTKKFESSVGELNDALDEIANPEEDADTKEEGEAE